MDQNTFHREGLPTMMPHYVHIEQVMLACISPCDAHYEETLGTLRYAERAKRVRTRAIANARREVSQRKAGIEQAALVGRYGTRLWHLILIHALTSGSQSHKIRSSYTAAHLKAPTVRNSRLRNFLNTPQIGTGAEKIVVLCGAITYHPSCRRPFP